MQNENIKVSERVNFKNLQIVNTLDTVVMRQWGCWIFKWLLLDKSYL